MKKYEKYAIISRYVFTHTHQGYFCIAKEKNRFETIQGQPLWQIAFATNHQTKGQKRHVVENESHMFLGKGFFNYLARRANNQVFK